MYGSSFLILTAAALASSLNGPAPVTIRHVGVELPTRAEAHVTLDADLPPGGLPTGIIDQRLSTGTVAVPLASAVRVDATGGRAQVRFTIELAKVPEGVLALDPNRLPVRWVGLGASGRPLLVATATLDLGDRGEVDLPIRKLQQLYTEVGQLSVAPASDGVAVRALIGLFNPFSFDVVVTRVEATVTVDGQPVVQAKRPGFRLRGQQSSDVLIEQDVPLGQLAGGIASVMGGATAELTGFVGIRTPSGERLIPLQAAGKF
ncbi:MAG: hypothetical protein ACM3O7_07860 [Acidobacteriota bacterium]